GRLGQAEPEALEPLVHEDEAVGRPAQRLQGGTRPVSKQEHFAGHRVTAERATDGDRQSVDGLAEVDRFERESNNHVGAQRQHAATRARTIWATRERSDCSATRTTTPSGSDTSMMSSVLAVAIVTGTSVNPDETARSR